MGYDVKAIEKRWQAIWEKEPFGKVIEQQGQKKYYCLDMFPYPSGSGLHVGHWRGYVLSDVYARIKVLQGYAVLHPMGWDAFGLPAENDALKKGIHPRISTARNIARFKEQLQEVAALYDWDKELNTTDPAYYKWTQWIFLKMFNAGLAYEQNVPINWCPSCLTGLANEEVTGGSCERCGTNVESKNIRQWMLRITDYAQKLLDGLEKLQWPEKVKLMQQHWIGKSEGATITFCVRDEGGTEYPLPIYTTSPETIYGVTFLAIAPHHELVATITSKDQKALVQEYCAMVQATAAKGQLVDDKEKTGVFTGAYVLNPLTEESIPLYVANYVLMEYGTGVVMGVPGHDERDFVFAQNYGIRRKQVIYSEKSRVDAQGNLKQVYTGDGPLVNSGPLDGLAAKTEGRSRAIEILEHRGVAHKTVTYKLRDWVFSRQRYWGEPIPLIHCSACGVVPVPEEQLPVELPDVERYEPTGTGESPLAGIQEWVEVACPSCGKQARRETNTMPQWAGSCWYFLRYPDPSLTDRPWDQEQLKKWLPVDLYVGGIEHAILHLLYARFYVKVLYDLGYISFDEPFTHLFNQGMVLKYSELSGQVEKMSKSKGNVVNPDEIVASLGSDVLRLYILFMGPPELDCEWQDTGLEGIKRFLHRLYDHFSDANAFVAQGDKEDRAVTQRIHQFVAEFQKRLDAFKPNTAISSCMELMNDIYAQSMKVSLESFEKIMVCLSTMAPHITSELLDKVLDKRLQGCSWPTFDPQLILTQQVPCAIQVNGKLRATLMIGRDASKDAVQPQAQQEISKWLENKQIVKVVFVPNRLINFVVS